MAKKKELKKLIERIEAIEAEIKALRETAEKNVSTISTGIEKLVAASKPVAKAPVKRTRTAPTKKKTTAPTEKAATKPEVKAEPEAKAEKPARKPRAPKKEPVAQAKEESAPSKAPAPAEEEPKGTRTRKPRAAGKEAARRTRTWKGTSFVLYNCDEAKSPESLYNRNDETFKDAKTGRRALWSKLKAEIAEGRIKILDNVPVDNIRLEILDGKPESVSKHLQYGLIEKVEPKAE